MQLGNKGLMTTGSAQRAPEEPWWFYVEALAMGAQARMTTVGSPPAVSLEYSVDYGASWNAFAVDGSTDVRLPNVGDRVYFRAGSSSGNLRFASDENSYHRFEFHDGSAAGGIKASEPGNTSVAIGGDIMSLFSRTKTVEFPFDKISNWKYHLAMLFSGGTYAFALKDASALILPEDASPYCCVGMFQNCYNLSSAPDLPATELQVYCYDKMFYGCSSLREAPGLPAVEMAPYCYLDMFRNSGLLYAPDLPAETLSYGCYMTMFYGCVSLIEAPELPATTLDSQCYTGMFGSCTNLKQAPKLSATSLASQCYMSMFNGCSKLIAPPRLPATSTTSQCYVTMFKNCSALSVVNTRQTSWNATNSSNWVSGVASKGIFFCPSSLAKTYGVNNIPTGWTASSWWGFYVVALTAGAVVAMTSTGSPPSVTLEYSTDGGATWSTFTPGTTSVTLTNVGDSVCFRSGSGGNTRFASSTSAYRTFTFSQNVAIGGNILSLLSQTEISALPSTTSGYTFTCLFQGATKLVDVSLLSLPATTLASYCYYCLFRNCSALLAGPELPATTLASYCYAWMFHNCKAMTKPPPKLPATTLTASCYRVMFGGCTTLRRSPDISGTTLASYSFYQMFYNCSALTRIKTAITAWGAATDTQSWVYGVSSSGVFACPAALPQARGVSYIPANWDIVNV